MKSSGAHERSFPIGSCDALQGACMMVTWVESPSVEAKTALHLGHLPSQVSSKPSLPSVDAHSHSPVARKRLGGLPTRGLQNKTRPLRVLHKKGLPTRNFSRNRSALACFRSARSAPSSVSPSASEVRLSAASNWPLWTPDAGSGSVATGAIWPGAWGGRRPDGGSGPPGLMPWTTRRWRLRRMLRGKQAVHRPHITPRFVSP